MRNVDLRELALKKVKITGKVIGKFGTFEIEQMYKNNTKEVLEQASNNRWFASESCVLLPSCSLHERSRSKAKNLGIGIWGLSKNNNNFRIIQKPVRVKSPASYASWFFNEWIGRKLFQS